MREIHDPSSNAQRSLSQHAYLGWTKREPTIKHCKSNIRVLAHLLLKELGNILHHTLKPCRLFEFRSRIILVFGVDKLHHDAFIFAMKCLGVRIHFNYNIIGVSWKGRVTSLGIRHIAFAVTLCTKKRVQLIVFHINHQALVRVRLVPAR